MPDPQESTAGPALAGLALLVLAAVFWIGFELRFRGLGEPSLWNDEIVHLEKTVASVDEPWYAWLVGLRVDRENGPLFYGSQRLGLALAEGETGVRLMPALSGCLTVLAIFAAGTAAGGWRIGVVASMLLSLAPTSVYFSREGRPYAAVMLVATLLLILLLRRNQAWTVPATYGVCIAAAYLGIVAGPVLLSFAVLALAERTGRRVSTGRDQHRGPHHLLAPALALGILTLLYGSLPDTRATPRLADPIGAHPLSRAAIERLLASLTVSGLEGAQPEVRTLVFLVLAACGIFALARGRFRRALHVLGMAVLPMAIWLILLLALDRWFSVRYTSAALPAFLVLVAAGIVWLADLTLLPLVRNPRSAGARGATWIAAVVATAALAAPSLRAARSEPWQKPDWRGMATLIADLTADEEPVIAHSWWPSRCLGHYLEETGRSIELIDVQASMEDARRAAAAADGAWLIAAGYLEAGEFRAWMRAFDPVLTSRLADTELFFYPGFTALLHSPGRAAALRRWLRLQGHSGDRNDFDGEELLLGAGWSFPEINEAGITYRWAVARTAEIGFLLGPIQDSTLRLRVLPFPSPRRPPQSVELELDGRRLGRLQLAPGWRDYEIEVSAARWREGSNVLTVRFGWLDSPAELDPSSADRRSLAAALDIAQVVRATGTR